MEVQTFLRFRFTRASHVSCLSSSIRQLSAVLCLLSFLLVPHAGAAVRLAAPFTDGAVLQRGARVPVWGTAAPGEAVRVTFAGQERSAVAGEDGRWRVDLAPMPASCEGRTLAANAPSPTPCPQGVVETDFTFAADGGVSGTVRLPDALSGEFVWRGQTLPLKPGVNRIQLTQKTEREKE